DGHWGMRLDINVTANHRLADEVAKILREQNLDASIVLTSSANAVVPKRGSEAYDVSKAALSHLVRELAISLAPKVRVNGISPATVVKGSTMFPRDRVIASLAKYEIKFDAQATDEELRGLLAGFYARRTLTHQPIDPEDCAAAILYLAGPESRCTNGPIATQDGLRWDIGRIFDGVKDGLRLCADAAPEGIASVGVDGWAVDYVRLDENGEALADPFCHRDERTQGAEKKVHEII